MKRSAGNLAGIITWFGFATAGVGFGTYVTHDYFTKQQGPEKKVLIAASNYVDEIKEQTVLEGDNNRTREIFSYARQTIDIVSANPELKRDAQMCQKDLRNLEEQLESLTPAQQKEALETASARLSALSDKFSKLDNGLSYGLFMATMCLITFTAIANGVQAYIQGKY